MVFTRTLAVPTETLNIFRRLSRLSFSRWSSEIQRNLHRSGERRSMHSGGALTGKLQKALDSRRQQGRLMEPASPQVVAQMVDFGSNDTLSLSSSGVLRAAFLDEIAKHPDFMVGSRSTRIFEGTTQYLLDLEAHIARFHRAESALFFPSGYEANVAIWSTIPQPGDFVVYDEYVHASIHAGMRQGRATTRMFAHNCCKSLEEVLLNICKSNPTVAEGGHTIFIAIESIYSMDADIPQIREMLRLTKDILPDGDVVFSIDEAHSNGLIGENGSGLVCQYGLEKEFGLRLHTCGKALGSTGAAVLTSSTIRSYLINYARGLIFSTAPAFASLAAVRSGYNILSSSDVEKRRCRLQQNIRRFLEKLTCHPEWAKCVLGGILSLPMERSWKNMPFQSPIIPLVTDLGQANSLAFALQGAGYQVNPVFYPIVPRDKERVRLVMHADNTSAQIDEVITLVMAWANSRRTEQNKRSNELVSDGDMYQNVAFTD